MKHHRETEIKLAATDRRQLVKRLSRLGFRVFKARHFERNCLFDFPDLRLGRSGRLLRLRSAAGEYLLTFKGPSFPTRRYASRAEIETGVGDGTILGEVLKNLGLKRVFVYEKYRTIYAEGNRAHVHEPPHVAYDETPIGNYLELEGPEKWIDEAATRLGYSPRDYITSTYLALYFQKCREKGKRPGSMIFKGRKSRLGLVAP